MAKFMALLYETPNAFRTLSPEEMQRVLEKYNAWFGKVGATGKMLGGEKLKEEGGRIVSLHKGQVTVTDGPYSETKEVIGGIFTIEAKNYDEAVAIVNDCPHLGYGRIELREIDPMAGG